MSGEGYGINEELNKRYEDVEKLVTLLPLKSRVDMHLAILEMIDHGCFCPDCCYSALGGEEE